MRSPLSPSVEAARGNGQTLPHAIPGTAITNGPPFQAISRSAWPLSRNRTPQVVSSRQQVDLLGSQPSVTTYRTPCASSASHSSVIVGEESPNLAFKKRRKSGIWAERT